MSYNSMPVVTFDLVFGTSKLERLNLSHNVIADIRKGKLTNSKWEVGKVVTSSRFVSRAFLERLFICGGRYWHTGDLGKEKLIKLSWGASSRGFNFFD